MKKHIFPSGIHVLETYLNRPVTFFAFDERQGLSEHTAPFDALVHILDGEVEIVISGKSFPPV